ncbi:MAG: NAD(P)-binding domain-containing protein [bacterium]|nr:NAD(P)-binding domain-containing protein [bacterium]
MLFATARCSGTSGFPITKLKFILNLTEVASKQTTPIFTNGMKKLQIGYIGLGKMGVNMVLRMREKGYDVLAYNRSPEPREEAHKVGIDVASSVKELFGNLSKPRTVCLMVSNAGFDAVLR